jgi:lipid A 4'-phosphatase
VSYLKSLRGQIVLVAFLITAVLLVGYPGIDLTISGLFAGGGFAAKEQWWNRLLHTAMPYLLALSMLAVLGIYACNRAFRRNLLGVRGRTVCYLLLVLLLGTGVIVNVAFKDHFGRARPRDIVEFGGSKRFTPAFVVSDQCERNCSFSSGEGAGAFFALALARALSRRRAALAAGVAFGIVVSVARIAAGAHFFSDVVVSFFVMLIVTDVLYHYLIAPAKAS